MIHRMTRVRNKYYFTLFSYCLVDNLTLSLPVVTWLLPILFLQFGVMPFPAATPLPVKD